MYVKCKGNFMEVKYFVICTDLLLPLEVNFSYFEIQIFMLLNWIPNPIFWPDCHPWYIYIIDKKNVHIYILFIYYQIRVNSFRNHWIRVKKLIWMSVFSWFSFFFIVKSWFPIIYNNKNIHITTSIYQVY